MKPVSGAGGYGIVIGPAASEAELADGAAPHRGRSARVDRTGGRSPLSRHPTLIDGKPGPRHIDLRPFVITAATTST